MKRDAVEWTLVAIQAISMTASAAGVWVAALTVKHAKEQAKQSQGALIRERRIDFELDVLRDLAEYNLLDDSVSGARSRFMQLAAMLPTELIPLSRAAVDLDSTPEAHEQVQAQPSAQTRSSARVLLRKEIQAEILQAIARRVSERH